MSNYSQPTTPLFEKLKACWHCVVFFDPQSRKEEFLTYNRAESMSFLEDVRDSFIRSGVRYIVYIRPLTLAELAQWVF